MAIEILPTKILYVCQDPIDVVNRKTGITIRARPAFPVDPNKTGTINTARRWAGNPKNSQDKYIAKVEFEEDNNPIEKVFIYSYEHRKDNLVFKVVLNDKYIVDFRPEQVLDVMSNGIIDKGNVDDKLVWAKVGSTMTLVREAGEEVQNIRKIEASMKKDVEAGIRTESGAYKSLPLAERKASGLYKTASETLILSFGQMVSAIQYDHKYDYYARNHNWLGECVFSLREKVATYVELGYDCNKDGTLISDEAKKYDRWQIMTEEERSKGLLELAINPPRCVKNISAVKKIKDIAGYDLLKDTVDSIVNDTEKYKNVHRLKEVRIPVKDITLSKYGIGEDENIDYLLDYSPKKENIKGYIIDESKVITEHNFHSEKFISLYCIVFFYEDLRLKLYNIADPAMRTVFQEIDAKIRKDLGI